MFSKTYFLSIALICAFSEVSAQNIDENNPVVSNGIEYGYAIKNEQTKSAKGEEYSRFELTCYATNRSGCTKLYAERTTFLSDDPPNLLATFNCSNANGKRLTSKSSQVKARDFYVNARMSENGKDITRSVKAGYIFRNGESVRNSIIVLVPLGERPMMSVNSNELPELR